MALATQCPATDGAEAAYLGFPALRLPVRTGGHAQGLQPLRDLDTVRRATTRMAA
jgi:hypothetical protein